ncbi:hypothetical protein [[Phormidium] sp. ETS-05]|uniref:hypothetical protein n=1 Tax=[Phormidium] sp. ETS-05 TaxID=222819 RepID=UPI0018EF2087|nr:hypothetical protein [[Phormidium] sp. ETS-05]
MAKILGNFLRSGSGGTASSQSWFFWQTFLVPCPLVVIALAVSRQDWRSPYRARSRFQVVVMTTAPFGLVGALLVRVFTIIWLLSPYRSGSLPRHEKYRRAVAAHGVSVLSLCSILTFEPLKNARITSKMSDTFASTTADRAADRPTGVGGVSTIISI